MAEINCPLPFGNTSHVVMAHGGGGRMTQLLIRDLFLKHWSNAAQEGHDSEVFVTEYKRLAITTDGFVVQPLFFPGGDIGSLAVNGIVNDLAMSGATPRYLTVSLILEEGLPLAALEKIVISMKRAADISAVQVIAGDTKVVEKGKGDGLYLSLSGVGEIRHEAQIKPSSIQLGDAIILSGDIGRHGIAVMNARQKIFPETEIISDCAPLSAPVQSLLAAGIRVHCLRDLTRGGLATALVELAEVNQFTFQIEEEKVPVTATVRSACELLGLDPFYVANEGRFVAFVPQIQLESALTELRRHEVSQGATQVGTVEPFDCGFVVVKTAYQTERILDRLSGEQLPRIC